MQPKDAVHSFSRDVAARFGVSAAIVLGYIAHRLQSSKTIRDGRRWFYTTLDELTERYPYLGRSTIYEAVKRLTVANGALITGNYNKRRKDKTTWYALRDERANVATEPCYFRVSEAGHYGIAEAVLINNLRYWIAENQKKEPEYCSQPLSPTTLAKHLPFSESTIKRALKHLVEVGVFVQSADFGEYALASSDPDMGTESGGPKPDQAPSLIGSKPDVDSESGGSNPDEVKSGQETLKGSIPDWTGSIPDMTGPKADSRGSNPDNRGSNPDDVTILVTSLKDNPLKEESLKEKHFKASVCVFRSNSSKAKLAEPKLGESAEVTNSGCNDFFEPVVSSIQELPKLEETKDSEDAVASPSSEPGLGGPSTAAPQSALKSTAPHFSRSEWPECLFLDQEVHQCCMRVLNLHTEHDQTFEALASHIESAAADLIRQTGPEELFRLYKIGTQVELNAELAAWSATHFAKFYDTKLAMPELRENAHYREMFVSHAHCFVNMAFHWLIFDGHPVYLGLPNLYNISFEVFKIISPWAEARRDQQRQDFIQKRTVAFASPDQNKENDPTLSPAEKMQVFNQSLQARNRIGRFDEWNHWSEDAVMIQSNSLALTRQFFQLNPALTPAHLNLVLDECLKLPREVDGLDPMWHAKNGYKISILLRNLAAIATQLNILSQLPPFNALQQEEQDT